MKIPYSLLLSYVDNTLPPDAAVTKLHEKSGEYVQTLSLADLKALVRNGAISGVGSSSRLKYVVLEDATAAAKALGEREDIREDGSSRRFTGLRTQASITVCRNRVRTKKGSSFVWQHIKNGIANRKAGAVCR